MENRSGFIWGLNALLSGIFPLIPWEIFFFIPFALEFQVHAVLKKPNVSVGGFNHLVLGVTVFAAVYGGLAHPLGILQAFDTFAGGEGICVVHPPPVTFIPHPFDLYYGYEKHAWCYALAFHVVSVSVCGWYFLYLLIFVDRPSAKAAGRIIILPQGHQLATAKEFYRRAAIWFFVTGLSQALPYFALFGEKDLGKILTKTGGYSKRVFTPGITELLAGCSWLFGGIFFAIRWMTIKPSSSIEPNNYPASQAGQEGSKALTEVRSL